MPAAVAAANIAFLAAPRAYRPSFGRKRLRALGKSPPGEVVMSHPKPQTSFTPAHLRPITITIPDTWTPEQALAVFELIDDLREKIFALYCSPIQDLLQEQQGCFQFNESDGPATDSSF